MPYGHATATSRRALRYRLTLLLRRTQRALTIAELIALLDQSGRPAPQPGPKTVADALRCELARGRVVKVRRGVYAPGRVDRRTAWWMQRQLDTWDTVERVSESTPTPLQTPSVPPPAPDVPAWLVAVRPAVLHPHDVERVSE